MSIALETGSGTKVYRYTGRMATDVTSEGGGEPAVVAASGSGIPVEPERRIGEFGLRTAGAAREIGLWYFFELGRDESLKLPDFELSELFLGVGSGIVTSEPRSRELEDLLKSLKRVRSEKRSLTVWLGETTVPSDRPSYSDLGRRLLAIREKIKASGAPLLDWDDFDREMAERRGSADQEGEA